MVPSRRVLERVGVAAYATPEEAVGGFLQLVEYCRAQQAPLEAPPAWGGEEPIDRTRARAVIGDALLRGAGMLTGPEAKEVLACYGVPVVETAIADCAEAAAVLAERIGYPVALKILSPDIIHKSDVGGILFEHGVLALDARMLVAPAAATGAQRFAIRPYPAELEETVAWAGARLVLRPIRPDDTAQHAAFFAALSPEDVRWRMFSSMQGLPPAQLARWTQIDYDREMAFIATRHTGQGDETVAVARAVADPDNDSAEFAVVVRSDVKGRGLGALLVAKLVAYCRARGTRQLTGETLPENLRMLALARRLGFTVAPAARQGTVALRLALAGEEAAEADRLQSAAGAGDREPGS